ncbi:MAG TPA: hypothetical protein VF244_11020 [Acidimicrobiales bacterium]
MAEAVKALVADLRSEGEVPADETITVVVSARPDGHGRVAVIGVDAASEDEWEGEALVSMPWWLG